MSVLGGESPTFQLLSDNGDPASSSCDDDVFISSKLDMMATEYDDNRESPLDMEAILSNSLYCDAIPENPYNRFPSPGLTPSPSKDPTAVVFSVNFCGKNFGEIGLLEQDLATLDWERFKCYIFSSLNLESTEEFLFTYWNNESRGKVVIGTETDYEIALKAARFNAKLGLKLSLNISRVGSFPGLRSLVSSGIKRVNSSGSRSQSRQMNLPKKSVTTSTSFLSFEDVLLPDNNTKYDVEKPSLANELILQDDHFSGKTFDELLMEMEREIQKKKFKEPEDFEFVNADLNQPECFHSEHSFDHGSMNNKMISDSPEARSRLSSKANNPPKIHSLLRGHPLPVKVSVYASERSLTPIFCIEDAETNITSGEVNKDGNRSLLYNQSFSTDMDDVAHNLDLTGPPIWFSNYMDKFKEDLSNTISHQIREELEELMGRISTQEVEGRLEGILGNYASVVQSKVVCCCKSGHTPDCVQNESEASPNKVSSTHEKLGPLLKVQKKMLHRKHQKEKEKFLKNLKKREQNLMKYMDRTKHLLTRLEANYKLRESDGDLTQSDNQILDIEKREKVMARIEGIRERHSSTLNEDVQIQKNLRMHRSQIKPDPTESEPQTLQSEISLLNSTLEMMGINSASFTNEWYRYRIVEDESELKARLSSRFLYDKTIPDGAKLPYDRVFVKKWCVLNDGTIPWDNQTVLCCVSEGFLKADFKTIPVPHLKPGQWGIIGADLRVPVKPGIYTAEWSFQHGNSSVSFGDLLWCKIEAVEKSSVVAARELESSPDSPSLITNERSDNWNSALEKSPIDGKKPCELQLQMDSYIQRSSRRTLWNEKCNPKCYWPVDPSESQILRRCLMVSLQPGLIGPYNKKEYPLNSPYATTCSYSPFSNNRKNPYESETAKRIKAMMAAAYTSYERESGVDCSADFEDSYRGQKSVFFLPRSTSPPSSLWRTEAAQLSESEEVYSSDEGESSHGVTKKSPDLNVAGNSEISSNKKNTTTENEVDSSDSEIDDTREPGEKSRCVIDDEENFKTSSPVRISDKFIIHELGDSESDESDLESDVGNEKKPSQNKSDKNIASESERSYISESHNSDDDSSDSEAPFWKRDDRSESEQLNTGEEGEVSSNGEPQTGEESEEQCESDEESEDGEEDALVRRYTCLSDIRTDTEKEVKESHSEIADRTPKLKKEVSNLHEAFQQRVEVKLDFEALPKSCIQNSQLTRTRQCQPNGNLTFDENHFVTVSRLPPPEFHRSSRPTDTDDESSMSDMVVVAGLNYEQSENSHTDNMAFRSHVEGDESLRDDIISLSSCSSYSDLVTGEDSLDPKPPPTTSLPTTETEETSTTDQCSQTSCASSSKAVTSKQQGSANDRITTPRDEPLLPTVIKSDSPTSSSPTLKDTTVNSSSDSFEPLDPPSKT